MDVLTLVMGVIAIVLGAVSEIGTNGRNLAGWGVVVIGIWMVLLGLDVKI